MADSLNGFYASKEAGYFDSVRKEILPLLPEDMARVLEVGCGSGGTLEWLKREKGCSWIAGIELSEESGRIAGERLDFFVLGNVEQMDLPFPSGSVDLVLCLDVLEHLVDPWAAVRRLCVLLRPGGFLIASLPNICHRSAIIPLLFRDRWDYQPSGILDRTHLRFFTRKTSVELLEQNGFAVDMVMPVVPVARGSKTWFLNLITFGLFRRFLTTQYLIRAKR